MTDDLQTLSAMWMAAKQAESEAIKSRRDIEDRMTSLIGVAENMEGTETAKPNGYTIKITGRMNRKIDSEKLQEIAALNGLSSHLPNLFRWKPEINASQWKAADDAITRPLLGAITTTPARLSFKIIQED